MQGVSIVIPCLNEQETLPLVLERIEQLRRVSFQQRPLEVLVVDNGSTDRSVEIALTHKARVVHCAERGYGAALRCGIQQAIYDIVAFADADNTYDFLELPKLLEMVEQGYDLVIGSRLRGRIEPGAMPFLHRYLGTPVLNWVINHLHGTGDYQTSDCNSGFRCFRKQAFLSWNVQSRGMEFASEMLVKALRARARIAEVPISLRRDLRHRTPHLRRWRDGMRHLLQVLLEAPHFFFWTGVSVFAVSWFVLLMSWWIGPMDVGIGWVFGVHTMMFAQLGTCVGLSIWSIGLFLAARGVPCGRRYRYVINLAEDKLFWYSVATGCGCLAILACIVGYWIAHGRHSISVEKETLVAVAVSINGILLVVNTLTAHMLKRA